MHRQLNIGVDKSVYVLTGDEHWKQINGSSAPASDIFQLSDTELKTLFGTSYKEKITTDSSLRELNIVKNEQGVTALIPTSCDTSHEETIKIKTILEETYRDKIRHKEYNMEKVKEFMREGDK